jgi:outer membrane protein assembly factor BamD (BamD/ComL family)
MMVKRLLLILVLPVVAGCFARTYIPEDPAHRQAKWTMEQFELARTRTNNDDISTYYYRAYTGAQEMIAKYPQHEMVAKGDAHYIAASSLGFAVVIGVEKRYSDGVIACDAFLANYPKHESRSEVYLKKGYYLESLARWQEAAQTYLALIDEYPSSLESDRARTQLDFIREFHPDAVRTVSNVD